MLKNLIITLLIFTLCSTAHAGLPPTNIKGLLDTSSAPTTFNFRAPFNQATNVGSATQLIETGNGNVLKNPSFEDINSAALNWTVSGAVLIRLLDCL
jgi:hypothetical protein